jgi:cation:H+ antiporter
MVVAILATLAGLAILAWSADKFVYAAAAVARYLGIAPLVIGMLVIGFGTSAPELVVAGFAAAGGNPELALGNAFGSNVANIGLILGVTALVSPVAVHRGVVRKELPVLLAVTALAYVLLVDRTLSSWNAVFLLIVLVLLITWSLVVARRSPDDQFATDVESEAMAHGISRRAAWVWLVVGLAVLVLSSRLLVWGAVGIAERLGWPDLVIGLTVVAIGTSAPELAAALAAARKGEGDLVVGNIIGSNLFNTLGVVGLAGVIAPATVSPALLSRDLPVVAVFTVVVVLFALGRKNHRGGQGRINRVEGAVLLAAFIAYTAYLLLTGI